MADTFKRQSLYVLAEHGDMAQYRLHLSIEIARAWRSFGFRRMHPAEREILVYAVSSHDLNGRLDSFVADAALRRLALSPRDGWLIVRPRGVGEKELVSYVAAYLLRQLRVSTHPELDVERVNALCAAAGWRVDANRMFSVYDGLVTRKDEVPARVTAGLDVACRLAEPRLYDGVVHAVRCAYVNIESVKQSNEEMEALARWIWRDQTVGVIPAVASRISCKVARAAHGFRRVCGTRFDQEYGLDRQCVEDVVAFGVLGSVYEKEESDRDFKQYLARRVAAAFRLPYCANRMAAAYRMLRKKE